MQLKLATSPWWVQGLVFGTLFGAAMTVFSYFRTGAWVPALGGGVVGGAFFGVVMGRYTTKVRRILLAGLEGFSPDDQRAIVHASRRGPVPTDPQRRAAARALLQRRRDNMLSIRRWSAIVFGAAVVLYVVLALTQTWLWGLVAAVFLGFLVMTLTSVPRMDRRLALFDGVAAESSRT